MKGLVFDIQTMSVNDGPGIRTTVFLKGCPLHCQWCHNYESQSTNRELEYFDFKCVGCGACSEICPKGCHTIKNGTHIFDRTNCIKCFECAEVCSVDALRVLGQFREASDVINQVAKDKAFFDNSGGGITISGGEPTYQPEFLVELLTKAKQAGLNTAIETSGICSTELLNELLPLVDTWLWDYKCTEPDLHKDLIGVDNQKIISNLHYILNKGATVVLRCVLIEGINDTPVHMNAIAKAYQTMEGIAGINLLPFHNLGQFKCKRLGLEPVFVKPNTPKETKIRWKKQLIDLGLSEDKFTIEIE